MISIWEKETFFAPQDVLIAGGGFAGLWSAANITLVDRGLVPTGASTRNAGFACFGSLSELVRDAETMGLEKMLELVEMRFAGLERIQKLFPASVIDFETCGSYELFNSQASSYTLAGSIDYLNLLLKPITGSKKTFRPATGRIASFGFGGTVYMIENKAEGYLHSGKLVQALMRKVQGMGVQIFPGIEVARFEPTATGIAIHTKEGLLFHAKQALVCTNAFARELLPEADVVPARGQVLLTSPLKKLPWKGTFHFDEGYYYFRNLGNRVLLGGARNTDFTGEQTTEFNTTETVQAALERFLREVILPNHQEPFQIEHRWSGIMGMGSEKSPIVTEVQPNLFCVLRLGGIGLALAPTVGQQISRMMLA